MLKIIEFVYRLGLGFKYFAEDKVLMVYMRYITIEIAQLESGFRYCYIVRETGEVKGMRTLKNEQEVITLLSE